MSQRTPDYPVHSLILNRWSARAMSGEDIDDATLYSLFEAARWAPSSFNNQPWRFIYAHRGTPEWERMYDVLVPFNQKWAGDAAVLMLVISYKYFEKTGKPSRTHLFDTGAACQNLALQGTHMELVVHAMEGFDYDQARAAFAVPDAYDIACMFAVGKPAPAETLPDALQEREEPSGRKPCSDFVYTGPFSKV